MQDKPGKCVAPALCWLAEASAPQDAATSRRMTMCHPDRAFNGLSISPKSPLPPCYLSRSSYDLPSQSAHRTDFWPRKGGGWCGLYRIRPTGPATRKSCMKRWSGARLSDQLRRAVSWSKDFPFLKCLKFSESGPSLRGKLGRPFVCLVWFGLVGF
jgi:hypothetical protein